MTSIPLNIDWQQILLHMFNFVLLAGGLYLLLYNPVKNFMDKREQTYRDMYEKAKMNLAESEHTKSEYEKKLSDIQTEIAAMKAETEKANTESRVKAEAEARAQADKIISAAKESARLEQEKAVQNAEKDIEDLAMKAAEKMVKNSTSEAYDSFLNAAERS